jgi:hypothetical protein
MFLGQISSLQSPVNSAPNGKLARRRDRNAITADRCPSISTSTPVAVFRTHPARSSAVANRAIAGRSPTP